MPHPDFHRTNSDFTIKCEDSTKLLGIMLRVGCTVPLGCNSGSWVLGSRYLDVSFSSYAAPTFYRGPGISYVSQISGPRILGLGSARSGTRKRGYRAE